MHYFFLKAAAEERARQAVTVWEKKTPLPCSSFPPTSLNISSRASLPPFKPTNHVFPQEASLGLERRDFHAERVCFCDQAGAQWPSQSLVSEGSWQRALPSGDRAQGGSLRVPRTAPSPPEPAGHRFGAAEGPGTGCGVRDGGYGVWGKG